MCRRGGDRQSDVLEGSRQPLHPRPGLAGPLPVRGRGHRWDLILVIFSLARSGRSRSAPAAVGAYIGAAYFFTSSTSFANPAITVGRMFSNTFAGIAPASVPSFIVAQVVGRRRRRCDHQGAVSRHHRRRGLRHHGAAPPGGRHRIQHRRGQTHDRQAGRALPLRPQRRPEPGRTGAARPLRARAGSWSSRPVPSPGPVSTPRSSRSSSNGGSIPPGSSPSRSATTRPGPLMSS